MIGIRRAEERAHIPHRWVESFYTFSYGEYDDPAHRGFGPLRVLNEDRVAPGHGFPPHPHEEVEIFSYLVEGSLEYRDDLGHGLILQAGDAQLATTGTGIRHSVMNASPEELLRVYQFHLLADRPGGPPSLQHWEPDAFGARGMWRVVASPSGREDSMRVGSDVEILIAEVERGDDLEYLVRPGRNLWLQVTHGRLSIAGERVSAGDGIAVIGEPRLDIEGVNGGGQVLLLDLG